MLPPLKWCLVWVVLAATGCCTAKSYYDDVKSFYADIKSHYQGSKLQKVLKAAQKYRDAHSDDPLEPAFQQLESWGKAATSALKAIGHPELDKLSESGLEVLSTVHKLYKKVNEAKDKSYRNNLSEGHRVKEVDKGKRDKLSGPRALKVELTPKHKNKLKAMNITLVLRGLPKGMLKEKIPMRASKVLGGLIADIFRKKPQARKFIDEHSPSVSKTKEGQILSSNIHTEPMHLDSEQKLSPKEEKIFKDILRPFNEGVQKDHANKKYGPKLYAGRVVSPYSAFFPKTNKSPKSSAKRELEGKESTINSGESIKNVLSPFLGITRRFLESGSKDVDFQSFLEGLVKIADQDLEGLKKVVDIYGKGLGEIFRERFNVPVSAPETTKVEMPYVSTNMQQTLKAGRNMPAYIRAPYASNYQVQSNRMGLQQSARFMPYRQSFPDSFSQDWQDFPISEGLDGMDGPGPSLGDIDPGSGSDPVLSGNGMDDPPDPEPPPTPPPKKDEKEDDLLDNYNFDNPGDQKNGTGDPPGNKGQALPPCNPNPTNHAQQQNVAGQYPQQNNQANNRPPSDTGRPHNMQPGKGVPNGQVPVGTGTGPQWSQATRHRVPNQNATSQYPQQKYPTNNRPPSDTGRPHNKQPGQGVPNGQVQGGTGTGPQWSQATRHRAPKQNATSQYPQQNYPTNNSPPFYTAGSQNMQTRRGVPNGQLPGGTGVGPQWSRATGYRAPNQNAASQYPQQNYPTNNSPRFNTAGSQNMQTRRGVPNGQVPGRTGIGPQWSQATGYRAPNQNAASQYPRQNYPTNNSPPFDTAGSQNMQTRRGVPNGQVPGGTGIGPRWSQATGYRAPNQNAASQYPRQKYSTNNSPHFDTAGSQNMQPRRGVPNGQVPGRTGNKPQWSHGTGKWAPKKNVTHRYPKQNRQANNSLRY